MNEQTQEFLKQLNREIERLEGRLKDAKEELKQRMESNPYNSIDFGLARYAESVTKVTAQLQVLYNQRYIFKGLFGITE